jgi:asparagine synthase (glutamine-hydrolysing)
MLNSLEVRAPFLDIQMIDFAFGRVSSDWKATPTGRKLILRRLAGRVLPPGFNVARKQGFGFPVDRALRFGPWRAVLEDTLLSPDSCFDRAAVSNLLRQLDRGLPVGEAVFALTMFALWRRIYRVTL